MADLEEIEKRVSRWDARDRARAQREVAIMQSTDVRVWYCDRTDRKCDGKPHGDYDYPHARGDQWPPRGSDWDVFLMLSGRGGGKTRAATEWIRYIHPYVKRIAIVGMTSADLRDTMMLGPSGLVEVCRMAGMGDAREWYEPSKRLFTFPNGTEVHGFTGEEPDRLRGGNFGAAWVDEPAHIPQISLVWRNLNLMVREKGLPGGAKIICTTTPLPIPWLVGDDTPENPGVLNDPRVKHIRVSSHANLDNLDDKFRNELLKMEGTRWGRQEIYGEILMDVPGSLWKADMIHYAPDDLDWASLDRIVVGVDPAGSTGKKSDDTGIVVVGVQGEILYVLEDRTGKYSPSQWARMSIDLYKKYRANMIVAEKNFGGDMVRDTLRNQDPTVPVKVISASRSKKLRAEPIVTRYEMQKVFHVKGLSKLEDEQLRWIPDTGRSPNRVDALVHAGTFLLSGGGPASLGRARRRTRTISPFGRR